MLETLTSVSLLTTMEIVGPALLAAAIAYGIFATRRRRRAEKKRTEEATQRLYRQGAEDEQKSDR